MNTLLWLPPPCIIDGGADLKTALFSVTSGEFLPTGVQCRKFMTSQQLGVDTIGISSDRAWVGDQRAGVGEGEAGYRCKDRTEGARQVWSIRTIQCLSLKAYIARS